MSAAVEGPDTLRPALTDISNTAVALHREHFGRGPGAAKTHLADNLVVCVLTDVFTPVERTLIEAGQIERVREVRAAHRDATERVYKDRMEAVIGRPVEARLSSIHVDPDVVVDIFVLGSEGRGNSAATGSDGADADRDSAGRTDGAGPGRDGTGAAATA